MNERRRSERAYLLALVLPATALLIRFNFDVATDHRPGLILFIIPVTLCAYLGGLRPGLLCTLCSALLTAFFLSKLFHSSTTVFSLGLVQWSTFVVAGGMISYFAEKLHQSQERVRLEESRLSGIFNSAIDGIVTVDDKLNVVYINPAAEKMFGYPSATLLGQSGRQLVPPAHGRLCERLIKSLTVSGALNNMVAGPVLGRRADGHEFPVDATISKLEVGGRLQFTLVIRDTSERVEAENKLREREALFRTLYESLEEGVSIWNADGCIEACNPAAMRILGRQLQNFIGTHYSKIPWQPLRTSGNTYKPEEHAVALVHATGKPLLGRERKLSRPDGSEIWTLSNAVPLQTSSSGARPKVMVTFTDITQRKQATEELLRVAEIVGNSEDAIFSQLLDGTIRTWNPGAERVFGYSAQDAIGKPLAELLMPPDQREPEQVIRARIQHGEHIKFFEPVYIRKNGQPLQISATASPIRNSKNVIVGVSVIARDVTERRQAQAALRESEERFRIVADTAPVLIWMCGVDKRHNYFNTGWLNFTGRALDEALGTGWTKDVHPDDLRKLLDLTDKSFEARAEYRLEYRLRRHDGDYRWVLSIAKPRFDAEGLFAGFIGTCVDITADKQAQEALLARDAAEEASRLKSEFLATMSHEFRTPLTGVIGFTEYLMTSHAGALNADQQECLDTILKSSLHLLDLINDILDLSKVEAGKMELSAEIFAVREIVEEVCSVISPAASKKGVALMQSVAPTINTVTLDPSEFKQVLYNLLSNAVKFTDGGGRVEIRVDQPEADWLRLSVTDTGIGIKPEDTGKLFQNFRQLDTGNTRRHEGTGLGLALTRKIVELQHGRITVESAPGRGSVFTVMLPLRTSAPGPA